MHFWMIKSYIVNGRDTLCIYIYTLYIHVYINYRYNGNIIIYKPEIIYMSQENPL